MKHFSIIFMLVFSFSVFGQTDTTAPEVSNLGIFPFTVNVASDNQNVTVSLRATDDSAGVANLRVSLRSPSRNQVIDADFNSASLASGDKLDGLYNKPIIFPQTSETGTWVVEYVYASDEAGNEKYIYTSELMARGLRTLLQVSSINCIYTLNSYSQDFPAEGGSGVVTGTTQTGCTASAFSSSSFIISNSISASSVFGSGILNISVPFTVPANTGAARTGTILVSGLTFTVNQAGAKTRKRVRMF